MKQSDKNRIIIAAAGSGKTEHIIQAALGNKNQRSLIVTYTTANRNQILKRIITDQGTVPSNTHVLGWYEFLINQCCRPFQASIIGRVNHIESLNLSGEDRYAKKVQPLRFYFDRRRDMYGYRVSQFACEADKASGGRVMKRLAEIYDHIYIDEVQDLAGYDLEFLERVFTSPIGMTLVGDPRQCIYLTNRSRRYDKYQYSKIMEYFELQEAKGRVSIDWMAESWRCNQAICDWADSLYPTMKPTSSRNAAKTGHDGIFIVLEDDVARYVADYDPISLRYDKNSNTFGLPAMNFGISKGSTFDRVLLFPSSGMRDCIEKNNLGELSDLLRGKLYVAATRARFSVALVARREIDGYALWQ